MSTEQLAAMSRAPGRMQKAVLLAALYLAQGLPFGFFTIALPILLRDAGFSLTQISALSLLGLPWALKFLWAPYLDRLGGRRVLLLTLQSSAIAGALLLSQLDIDRGYVVLIVAAFVFNIIAASQDVVTDGLAVRTLGLLERGPANAVQVGAYRIGMTLGGGLLLWIFAKTDWSTMFMCMAILLAATVVPVLAMQEPPRTTLAPPPFRELALGWLQRLLAPGMMAFGGLILCFRFGDAMVSTLLGPFMKDQQLSMETIALMKGTVGNATSLAGALLGGWYAYRVGRRRALLTTGIAQAATFIPYLIASFGIGGAGLLWGATILEGIVGTMATVALFTLMMDASDPQHAGTDYTLLASIYVLAGNIGNWIAAPIADHTGYSIVFAIGTLLTVLGTLVIVFTLDRRPVPARVADAWLLK